MNKARPNGVPSSKDRRDPASQQRDLGKRYAAFSPGDHFTNEFPS